MFQIANICEIDRSAQLVPFALYVKTGKSTHKEKEKKTKNPTENTTWAVMKFRIKSLCFSINK